VRASAAGVMVAVVAVREKLLLRWALCSIGLAESAPR
jgi:hypothetical protein